MLSRKTYTFSQVFFLGTDCNLMHLTSEPPLHISYRSLKQLSACILQRAALSKDAGNTRMLTVWGKVMSKALKNNYLTVWLFFFSVYVSDLWNKQVDSPSEFASMNYSESWLEFEGRNYFSILLRSEINSSKQNKTKLKA